MPKGSIYGFLGHNGAGKTTTIKLLLHLLRSQARNIFLFGQELQQHRIEILRRVGSLIEQPAIYEHMSGRENLLNRALLLGVDKAKVNELLELVRLTASAQKKAGNYSLGMKQRLGIALALLGDPELLLLDEPTNGLDPNGIIEMRRLLQELTQKHGKTVFVSSHLLSEVERMATHVGIVHKGKLLFQGGIVDLLELHAGTVQLEVDRPEAALSVLTKQGYAASMTEQFITLPYYSQQEMAQVNGLLVGAGFLVYSLQRKVLDLENLFLNITNTTI